MAERSCFELVVKKVAIPLLLQQRNAARVFLAFEGSSLLLPVRFADSSLLFPPGFEGFLAI